jgi:hypothetical protein
MVGDKRTPSRKRLKRRTSWKETIRGFTSGGDDAEQTSHHKHSKVAGSSGSARRSSFLIPKSQDNATETDEEEDFRQWKEEDRPLQARVRYVYPSSNPDHNAGPIPLSGSVMERHQEALTAAVNEANMKVVEDSESKRRDKEIIGTRLAMTSRTGYFQDRIISPSMVSIQRTHMVFSSN